jgi:hypothetical protein
VVRDFIPVLSPAAGGFGGPESATSSPTAGPPDRVLDVIVLLLLQLRDFRILDPGITVLEPQP